MVGVLLRCILDTQVSHGRRVVILVSHYHTQVMGRVQRGYLKCEEVREVYEADNTTHSRTTDHTSPGIIVNIVHRALHL